MTRTAMRPTSRTWCRLVLAVVCSPHSLAGQSLATPAVQPRASSDPGFHVSFRFERSVAGVPVPRYSMELRDDGTGLYHAEIRTSPADMQTIERPLTFSAATVQGARDSVHLLHASGTPCASKLKNIADTGTKTIVYRNAGGDDTCTYNFTENKGAIQLTNLFQGVEITLEEGRALDLKHRFDRLGLDAEIATLVADSDAGRALELRNIAPTLRSIAEDTELIERVRSRAATLLKLAETSE